MENKESLRGCLLENALLSDYTSWRVGGRAEILYIPADLDDLAYFLRQVPAEKPILWLGLGSNVLIRDGGFEGVVIITQGALSTISQLETDYVRAEAGVACAQIARYTARIGLKGLEFMAGIPGTVGGALAMNAGCWGGETWQHVVQVETINRLGQRQVRPAADYEIAYRHVTGPKEEWFTAGYFKLALGDKKNSLTEIHNLLEKRSLSQPTGLPNCGSVFRNPQPDFAARLIEKSGLKGMRMGDAVISEKHANFIINEGKATAADIESLIIKIVAMI
ncbi:MAG: murB [Gammaproteobacteria bacterium]|nr:murB [Gammaproteobacteria bacterium]